MNEQSQYNWAFNAALIFASTSLTLTGAREPTIESWPTYATPTYKMMHSQPSYSSFESSLTSFATPSDTDFACKIAEFYAELLEGQEPLGADFEEVWYANVDSLYES